MNNERFTAALLASCFGLITFFTIYNLLGFATSAIIIWFENKLSLGGVYICHQ